MAGVSEENRRRVARAICFLGIALILVGIAIVLHHRTQLPDQDPPAAGGESSRNKQLAHAIQQVLFWVIVLMGIFGLSSYAFLRWSRRFRGWVFHRPHPPTVADDVWSRHRLPEEDEPEASEPPGYPRPED